MGVPANGNATYSVTFCWHSRNGGVLCEGMQAAPLQAPPPPGGFSLVEVVIALGILAFTITALIGMLVVGMNTDRESIEELQATHILQTMISERRANPSLDDQKLLLPRLDKAAARDSSDPVSLDEIGRTASPGGFGKFGLVYRVTPDLETKSAGVYCAIFWPGRATPTTAQGRVEMATRIALP